MRARGLTSALWASIDAQSALVSPRARIVVPSRFPPIRVSRAVSLALAPAFALATRRRARASSRAPFARARSSRSSSFASHLVVARLANGRLLRRDLLRRRLLRRRLLRRRGFLHRRLRRGGFRLEHRECARVVGVWRRARSSERSRADRIARSRFLRARTSARIAFGVCLPPCISCIYLFLI